MNIERPSISRCSCGVSTNDSGDNKCQVDEDQDQGPDRDRAVGEDGAGMHVGGEEDDDLWLVVRSYWPAGLWPTR